MERAEADRGQRTPTETVSAYEQQPTHVIGADVLDAIRHRVAELDVFPGETAILGIRDCGYTFRELKIFVSGRVALSRSRALLPRCHSW